MVHPPFLPGYYLRTLAFWRWYPRLLLLSFEMLMILGRWILHTIVNRLSQYQLRAQLVFFCISETVAPTPNSWADRCPSTTQSVRFCPHSLLQQFRQLSRQCFLEFFPFFIHFCFCIWYFRRLGHRSELVHKIFMTQRVNELNSFPAVRSSWYFGRSLSKRSVVGSATSLNVLLRLQFASFRIIPCWITLKWGWRRPVWLSSKIILFFSSVWALQDYVLRSWSPSEILTVPSATGKIKLSPFIGVNTSFAWSLRAWSSDGFISCTSSMSAITMSPFQVLPAYNT